MPYTPEDKVVFPNSIRATIGVQFPWRLPDFRLVPKTFDKTQSQGMTLKDVLKKQGL